MFQGQFLFFNGIVKNTTKYFNSQHFVVLILTASPTHTGGKIFNQSQHFHCTMAKSDNFLLSTSS